MNLAVRTEVRLCDITRPADFERLFKVIKTKRAGRLDAVIVNSGFSGPVVTDVLRDDVEIVKSVMDVNHMGTYRAAHYLIPFLLGPSSSSIESQIQPVHQKAFIAVGSHASLLIRVPIANTQYCISKLAQLKLIEHIHEQYASSGILAVAVHPGAVASGMALLTAPEELLPYLTDDGGLCGAFCVWLSNVKVEENKMWLSGRHLSAKWDVNELVKKKEGVVTQDLLKV